MKYAFSSKIECGICGTNYTRRMNEKRKDGTRKVYWACCNRTVNVKNCEKSLFVAEDNLKEIFIQIYNSIIEKKHQTKDKLLKAIQETLKEEDNNVKLDKLLASKKTLEERLSHLIDMKLDDYENKNAYVSKEKEINVELKRLDDEIKNYEIMKSNNKNISNQLKEIEKVLNAPKTIKDFDDETFNSLVEKIIVGEKDENGNINPNVIRFILKIGTEYTYQINGNKNVSYRPNNVERFSKWCN